MCGIIGVIDRSRRTMNGTGIRAALSQMDERGSGEGAGYAVYGAFPDLKDYYAIHVFFDNLHETKPVVEEELAKWGTIEHQEAVPTFEQANIRKMHIPWRF